MVESGDDLFFEQCLQFLEVEQVSCTPVDKAGKGDFHHIVVSVPEKVAAFAIDASVFFVGEFRIEQPVSGIELDIPGDVDFSRLLEDVVHERYGMLVHSPQHLQTGGVMLIFELDEPWWIVISFSTPGGQDLERRRSIWRHNDTKPAGRYETVNRI